MIKIDNIFGLIIIAGLGFLLITQQCSHNREIVSFEKNQKAFEDTIKVTRNKLGQSVGKISIIETNRTKDFLALATKDSTIQKLQQVVKTYKSKLKGQGVVVIANTEATVSVTAPTVIDSTNKTSPIYTSSFKLRDSLDKKKVWVYGSTIAKKDSTQISLKYREEVELLIGEESTGFLGWGKAKSFGQITFKNPYSEVKEMKIYQKESPKKKYWHIGPTAGYGITSDGTSQIFLGVGVMWTPISF